MTANLSLSETLEILISEVGPRDGLQSVQATMPTADKLRWIDALYAAGVHKLTVPVSASAAHPLANVRMTREAMVEEVRAIAALRADIAPHVGLEAGISTAFGGTLQGDVAEDDVIWLAAQCIAAGADESGLSDTVGYVNPAQVRRLFRRLRAEIGRHAGAVHLHNTRGLGLANCLAAYDEGVRTFRVAGWAGRLPVCARRVRQRGHLRPGLHVRGHGRSHRH